MYMSPNKKYTDTWYTNQYKQQYFTSTYTYTYHDIDLRFHLCVTHRGTELIPPCIVLCTVPTFSVQLCYIVCSRAPSAARSCAAWDYNNKDNVCKPNIPAGISARPLLRPSHSSPGLGTILNTLSERIPRRPTRRSSVIKPGTL